MTDFEKVKKVAIEFLYIDPVPNEVIPIFADHPYFENQIYIKKDGSFVDIFNDSKGLEHIQRDIERQIMKTTNVYKLLCMIRTPYHLAFLKYTKRAFSKHEFDKLLAYIWVNSENPNQDANVGIKTLTEWFKRANKRSLMTLSEYKYYIELPAEVNVYRGVAVGRAESKGLSWTCNFETAKWFSERFDNDQEKGYILKGTIKKEDIFAYFNGRNEDEICCDSSKITNLTRINRPA